MSIELNEENIVLRDSQGHICQLDHLCNPYTLANANDGMEIGVAPENVTPKGLADAYIRDVMPHMAVAENFAAGIVEQPSEDISDDGNQLRFSSEKQLMGNTTVSYRQTYFGIPIWGAAMSVNMETEPAMAVTGSSNSLTPEIEVKKPGADAGYRSGLISAGSLAGALGIPDQVENITINESNPFVYRFDASIRTAPGRGDGGERGEEKEDFELAHPTLPLPDVDGGIEDGRFYVVSEVLFTLADEDGAINWTALLEVEAGSVLYLNAMVGCLTTSGSVYLTDPPTKSGDTTISPASSQATLDGFRDTVDIEVDDPDDGDDVELKGRFVRLQNVINPNTAAPTSPDPGDFSFSVPTNDFGAVTAYYSCDRLFQMMENFGFDVAQYFDGTSFPVRVDHRVSYRQNGALTANVVNASAPGTANNRGSDGFRFALGRRNTTLNIAADWRVVLHEFGHAVLWDNVHWPNFGFAHSPGDFLAAVLNDPESGLTGADRGISFPWINIGRRHDRPVSSWAWRGPDYGPFTFRDPAGYDAEQILSTTLFRLYLSAGGGSTDIGERQFASFYTAFITLKAVGLLSPPRPSQPEFFANLMASADTGTFLYEGAAVRCGVLRKTIRWAFEQQGAYSSSPPPITTASQPRIDLFIEDGRAGDYTFQEPTAASPGVWVRNQADGQEGHQAPVAGSTNYIYAKIGNRGSVTAPAGGTLSVFHSTAADDAALWPSDWSQIDAPVAIASVPSGDEQIVGPIEWTPDAAGGSLLATLEHPQDPSLAGRFSAATAIETRRLVPNDNNIVSRAL